jgi:uncharacterized protein YegP (UPF0339 family)
MSKLLVPALAALLLSSSLLACATETDDPTEAASALSWSDISSRPSFELWKGDDGQFRFQLLDAHAEVLASSQGYSSRGNALNGLLSVVDNGRSPSQYKVALAAEGGAYFNLLAANRAVIATSDRYADVAAAQAHVSTTITAVAAYTAAWDTATGARFAIHQDVGGKYYFNLHAKNGEIVLHSERYDGKAAALNGAFSVADNGVTKARYQVLAANGGGYYLNLTATNGQIIATSEVYSSKSNAERARDSIIALLPQVALL